jgi:hypothetical protein
MTALPVAAQARELSADEAEARGELCFQLDQQIKQGIAKGREAMWEVAKAAHEFDEQSGWTALGYDQVGEWLADPEVSMSRRTFFRLVSTYRELVVLRKIKPAQLKELDTSKVDIVLPAVKSGRATLTDALEDVKGLGASDLREKYIKRPDPAAGATPPPESNDIAVHDEARDDDAPESWKEPATNPTDDTPQFASEVEVQEPAHNSDKEESGHLQDGPIGDSRDTGHTASPVVIEGNGHDVNPPVSVRYAAGIRKLAQEGREALARPDRMAPDRRAKREALENLILALEAAGLA